MEEGVKVIELLIFANSYSLSGRDRTVHILFITYELRVVEDGCRYICMYIKVVLETIKAGLLAPSS